MSNEKLFRAIPDLGRRGRYACICCKCGDNFSDDNKRAVICLECKERDGAMKMWAAKLCEPETGYVSDLECDAETLLEAAQILSRDLKPPQYIDDLCCRGWITHSITLGKVD